MRTAAGMKEGFGYLPGNRLRGTRAGRIARSLFAGVWLVYLIQPAASVATGHHSAWYTDGALAIVAAFCVLYVGLLATPERFTTLIRAQFAALFLLAMIGSAGYGGVQAWIFVSVVVGMVFRSLRTATRVVMAIAACYLITGLIAHVDTTTLFLDLIPVVLVGFAMLGFRRQADLMRELTQARETVARMAANEERLRLARDLHDLTGQSLSMVTLKSELAARLLRRLPEGADRDRALDEVEQVASVSRQTLHDIREAISGYRRPTLAVEIITARTALDTAGIVPHDDPQITLLSGTFDPDAEAALAWCLREAVTNVVRHSGARNCYLTFARRAGGFSLEVRDDGRGHPSGTPAGGTGLHGMSERLCAVGGHMRLRPGTGGFCLVATVPVTESANVAV